MLIVPLIIGVANVSGNMVLNYIGFWEKWHTEALLKTSIAENISVFNILNTGFIIFFVNMKSFGGDYDYKLSTDWYEDVGM